MKGIARTIHGDTATMTTTAETALAKNTVTPIMHMTRRESIAVVSFVNLFIKRLDGYRSCGGAEKVVISSQRDRMGLVITTAAKIIIVIVMMVMIATV